MPDSGGTVEEGEPTAEHKACELLLTRAHEELDRAGVPRWNDDDLPPRRSVAERIAWLVADRSEKRSQRRVEGAVTLVRKVEGHLWFQPSPSTNGLEDYRALGYESREFKELGP